MLGISPCATRWRERKKEKKGRVPFVRQVLDFVLFCFVPRGEGKKFLPTLTIYVDLVVKTGKIKLDHAVVVCLTCRGNVCEDSGNLHW